MNHLRDELIDVALRWERAFGNAPSITSALSEYDAAHLVGCAVDDYSLSMKNSTSVQRGHDFVFNNIRYQVKANRPSGKRGSKVTLVPRAANYAWDQLIWILYNPAYQVQEAWLWNVEEYQREFGESQRLAPQDLRRGVRLFPPLDEGEKLSP